MYLKLSVVLAYVHLRSRKGTGSAEVDASVLELTRHAVVIHLLALPGLLEVSLLALFVLGPRTLLNDALGLLLTVD